MIIGLEVAKRRTFASALEWPGWSRSAKNEDLAVEALLSYTDRFARIAERAGLKLGKDAETAEVIERVEGNATTEFGAPAGQYSWDAGPIPARDWKRTAALFRASWAYFDDVVASAPESLRKGPRGGGRDRDAIAAHVLGAEVEYGRKLGLERWKPEGASAGEIGARREAIVSVFLAGGDGRAVVEKGWPLRFAARRGIWHVIDHAWEIEDRSDQ